MSLKEKNKQTNQGSELQVKLPENTAARTQGCECGDGESTGARETGNACAASAGGQFLTSS